MLKKFIIILIAVAIDSNAYAMFRSKAQSARSLLAYQNSRTSSLISSIQPSFRVSSRALSHGSGKGTKPEFVKRVADFRKLMLGTGVIAGFSFFNRSNPEFDLESIIHTKYPDFDKNYIHRKNEEGKNLLMVAVVNNDKEVVKYLLKNYNLYIDDRDAENKSALYLAIEKEHNEIVQMIITSSIFESGIINTTIDRFNDAFAYAAEKGNEKAIEIILKADADDGYIDEYGYQRAFKEAIKNNHKKVLEFLINNTIWTEEKDLNRALVVAYKCKNIEVVKMLLKAGADISTIMNWSGCE